MGKTWKKKIQRGRKGKPHNQRVKTVKGFPGAKLQRALRQELDIVQEQVNQSKEKKA